MDRNGRSAPAFYASEGWAWGKYYKTPQMDPAGLSPSCSPLVSSWTPQALLTLLTLPYFLSPCLCFIVSPLVMVNFLCQPDRTMGFPDIWLNITSGCVFEGFWMRWTFESVDGVKQIVLTTVGGPHQISWKLEWKKDQVRKHCLSLFIVFKQVHWCSPAFRLELRLELVPSSLLVLQLADCRSWIFQPL